MCPKCRDGVVQVKPKLLPGPHVAIGVTCPICRASGDVTSDDYRALELPRWTSEQAHKIIAGAIKWEDLVCPVDGTPVHVDRSQRGRNVVIAAICPRCLNEARYEDISK